jgi:hypothetical protein
MVQEADTYITPELRASVGTEVERMVSFQVGAGDIRRWAIAVYWPETPPRLYWDEAYAQTTPFKGIIAPQEFNPFSWPPERPPEAPDPGSGGGSGPGTRFLNGGNRNTYLRPIRPGDVITSVTKIAEVFERSGRLGRMLFTVRETTWTNQKGQVVRVLRQTGIRY